MECNHSPAVVIIFDDVNDKTVQQLVSFLYSGTTNTDNHTGDEHQSFRQCLHNLGINRRNRFHLLRDTGRVDSCERNNNVPAKSFCQYTKSEVNETSPSVGGDCSVNVASTTPVKVEFCGIAEQVLDTSSFEFDNEGENCCSTSRDHSYKSGTILENHTGENRAMNGIKTPLTNANVENISLDDLKVKSRLRNRSESGVIRADNKASRKKEKHKMLNESTPKSCSTKPSMVCKKRFVSSKGLKRTRQPRNGRPIAESAPNLSEDNDKRISSPCSATLKDHRNVVHANVNAYVCAICHIDFSHARSYQRHMRTHREGKRSSQAHIRAEKPSQKKKPSPCRTPQQQANWKNKPTTCKVCNKKLNNGSLKLHLMAHRAEKPFQCEICSRRFLRSSSLKEHINKHTGDRPFLCNICGSKFAQSCSLRAHMAIHGKGTHFACNLCDHKFQRIQTLKDHLNTHEGVKPYICSVTSCSEAFASAPGLHLHMKKRHNINEPPTAAVPLTKSSI